MKFLSEVALEGEKKLSGRVQVDLAETAKEISNKSITTNFLRDSQHILALLQFNGAFETRTWKCGTDGKKKPESMEWKQDPEVVERLYRLSLESASAVALAELQREKTRAVELFSEIRSSELERKRKLEGELSGLGTEEAPDAQAKARNAVRQDEIKDEIKQIEQTLESLSRFLFLQTAPTP
jgi:hypothetical protein